ncbi:MAG: hypothetical protein ACJ8DX_05430 [Xanthobacteraceae bacterium]
MTTLIVRMLVVLAAFLVASLVAAFVITFGVLMDWEQILSMTGFSPGWFAVAFFGLIVSAKGLVSALLVIVLTEALRLRSPLFYAAAGGTGLVALYYGLGLAERGPGGDVLVGRELEIMAGAGIAAGFVYWAIAGRNAGAWREHGASSSP